MQYMMLALVFEEWVTVLLTQHLLFYSGSLLLKNCSWLLKTSKWRKYVFAWDIYLTEDLSNADWSTLFDMWTVWLARIVCLGLIVIVYWSCNWHLCRIPRRYFLWTPIYPTWSRDVKCMHRNYYLQQNTANKICLQMYQFT